MKVLLELRPAFDGHSGIPQETRLLFRGLAGMEGIEVSGLIQSSNLVLEEGIPTRDGEEATDLSPERRVDRLSRLVVSLQQGPASRRGEHYRRRLIGIVRPGLAALRSLFGGRVKLGSFDPSQFKDFIWRALFAKSLPEADLAVVTQRPFRVMRWPYSSLHAVGVVTSLFGRAVYPRLDTSGVDVFIAETPYPGRVSGRTRMVVRYHDAIPLFMPHTIKDRGYHRTAHYRALMRNAADGAWFACVSEATRRDLLSVMPGVAGRTVTIPNMVSHHFFTEQDSGDRVPEVVWSRKNRSAPHGGGAPVSAADLTDGALEYLLMVCTIEPRKNHLAVLDAWERLRARGADRLALVFVGSMGWEHQAILQRCAPWLERGGLHLLENVPAADLRLLYRHAAATVCPSFGEGFDFPGIEAMCSGGVVIASDIAVHRDVFADGCRYFNPYSVDELVEQVTWARSAEAAEARSALVAAGAQVAARYAPHRVLPVWREFLSKVASDPA